MITGTKTKTPEQLLKELKQSLEPAIEIVEQLMDLGFEVSCNLAALLKYRNDKASFRIKATKEIKGE